MNLANSIPKVDMTIGTLLNQPFFSEERCLLPRLQNTTENNIFKKFHDKQSVITRYIKPQGTMNENQHVLGLIVSPQKSYIEILIPGTSVYDFYGNWVIADGIS